MTGELRALRRLARAGSSLPAAARALGRSQSWARSWKRRESLVFEGVPPWRLAHLAAVAQARLAGTMARLSRDDR